MMISNTVNPKGMSPSRMRQVMVLLFFSLKFTHVEVEVWSFIQSFHYHKKVIFKAKTIKDQ